MVKTIKESIAYNKMKVELEEQLIDWRDEFEKWIKDEMEGWIKKQEKIFDEWREAMQEKLNRIEEKNDVMKERYLDLTEGRLCPIDKEMVATQIEKLVEIENQKHSKFIKEVYHFEESTRNRWAAMTTWYSELQEVREKLGLTKEEEDK